jgi:hypothetical protein
MTPPHPPESPETPANDPQATTGPTGPAGTVGVAWWQSSPSYLEVAAAYVAALGELDDVTRTRTADTGSYSYRYADLGAVLGAARSVLAGHGLALFQVVAVDGREVEVATTIMHTSAQWLTFAPMRLPAGTTAQAAGSAMTYARRYSALAVLGLATDDDDGATAAPRHTGPPTMNPANVARFYAAATDVDAAAVVLAATGGRTDDPAHVYVTEVDALRHALDAARLDYDADALDRPDLDGPE